MEKKNCEDLCQWHNSCVLLRRAIYLSEYKEAGVMRKQPDTLKYGLEDVVPRQELPLYTLQHIVYFAAGIIVLPIAVGLYLGLSQGEIAEFLQRTFFL